MLSTIGGTMGLLTGFSIISGVEIVYFAVKIARNYINKWIQIKSVSKLLKEHNRMVWNCMKVIFAEGFHWVTPCSTKAQYKRNEVDINSRKHSNLTNQCQYCSLLITSHIFSHCCYTRTQYKYYLPQLLSNIFKFIIYSQASY